MENGPMQAKFLTEFHQARSADRLRVGSEERHLVSESKQYGMVRVRIYRCGVFNH